jgi:hypothetical protein
MIKYFYRKPSEIYNIAGVYTIVLFILTCIYLAYINNSIWFDEAYTLAMVNRSWGEIIAFTANDFHPPLYYFIAKAGLLLFGGEIFTLRMISLLPIFLLFIYVRKFLVQVSGHYAFLLFSLAFFASSTIVMYALEIRMYSYTMFFVSMTYISTYYALKTDSIKWYICLFLYFLATFYTHYYAGIFAGIGYVFLILYTYLYQRKRLRIVLAIAALSFILFLPWLIIVLKQLSVAADSFWINTFHWTDGIKFMLSLFSSGNLFGSILLLLVFLSSVLLYILKKNKSKEDYFIFFGLLNLLSFILFCSAISIIIRPLFVSRYLVPACGVVWLFFAFQSSSLPIKVSKNLLPIILLGLGINSFISLKGLPLDQGYLHFQKNGNKNFGQNDILIIPEPEISGGIIGVIAYLFPDRSMAITNSKAERRENHTLDYHLSPFKMKILRYSELQEVSEQKKWLLIPYNAINKNIEEFADDHTVIHRGNFGWVGFQTGYQFDLYEIIQKQ